MKAPGRILQRVRPGCFFPGEVLSPGVGAGGVQDPDRVRGMTFVV